VKLHLPKIYPITDRGLSKLTHSDQVRAFIDGGARWIQVRDKTADPRTLFKEVSDSLAIARANGCTIIVNDRVDLAMLAEADGVHLGQDDLPASAARKLLGKDRIIGVSTHTIDQVRHALDEGVADYLAFGPIFHTATKTDHEPLVGLEMLSRAKDEAQNTPVVAIGGINSGNIQEVFHAGADSAAMISEFFIAGSSIEHQYRKLAQQIGKNGVVTG
jgi:thiamine-phosphate pyrophosphorylase